MVTILRPPPAGKPTNLPLAQKVVLKYFKVNLLMHRLFHSGTYQFKYKTSLFVYLFLLSKIELNFP